MLMNIKTVGFEGPLDLLLHLIKSLEIDIYDIPMQEITEQYLIYIHTMQELQLDVASEYLVMAAELLAIKSKMLLPKHDPIEGDLEYEDEYEEDPRDELVAKLIEYRKFKEASLELKEKEKERSLFYTKPPSDLSEYSSKVANVESENKATIYDMLGAFHKLMRRKRLQKPLQTRIAREEISIEKRIEEVYEELITKNNWVDFFELFPYPDKNHIVTTFLAILELMKRNQIKVQQEENFSDLLIAANRQV